jgi:arabinogalactan endo-1,4-beta-galactosidase
MQHEVQYRWLRHLGLTGAIGVLAVAQVAAQSPYIVGADISYLNQAESGGTVFKDGGVPRPALEILKDHGYNWVRLRLFVHPDKLANDQPYTIAAAQYARKLGYKILLDFHYSDTWADPGHQDMPKQWVGQTHAQLVQSVFTYTRDTVAAFRDSGALPDMVQIGNEITHGMMWPDGRIEGDNNWQNFTDLLKAGINGVDAGHGNLPRPLIMIHIDRGGDWTSTKQFFDKIETFDVRYDVIGQSYHPWWQGSLEDLRDNLYHSAVTYHRQIVLAEVSYPWKPFSAYGANLKESQIDQDKLPAYPETPEGQAEWLRELNRVVETTPGNLGAGLFWWEPAVPKGRALRGRGLFGDDGNALPAITAFDGYRRK